MKLFPSTVVCHNVHVFQHNHQSCFFRSVPLRGRILLAADRQKDLPQSWENPVCERPLAGGQPLNELEDALEDQCKQFSILHFF